MKTVEQFTIAKKSQMFKDFSSWENKEVVITYEYYLAIRNEIILFSIIWIDVEGAMLCNIQGEGHIPDNLTLCATQTKQKSG